VLLGTAPSEGKAVEHGKKSIPERRRRQGCSIEETDGLHD
jgi:hypothetical protein